MKKAGKASVEWKKAGCHGAKIGERERWDEVDLVTLIALFGLTAAGCKEVAADGYSSWKEYPWLPEMGREETFFCTEKPFPASSGSMDAARSARTAG